MEQLFVNMTYAFVILVVELTDPYFDGSNSVPKCRCHGDAHLIDSFSESHSPLLADLYLANDVPLIACLAIDASHHFFI
jgi:hypothetical protein